MELIIKGKRLEREKQLCFQGIEESIMETLSAGVPDVRRIVAAQDALGHYLMEDESFLVDELMELGLSRSEAAETKQGSAPALFAEESSKKIKRELGGLPFEISRLSPRETEFEGWMPLGVLGHVTSSNDAMLPFSALWRAYSPAI